MVTATRKRATKKASATPATDDGTTRRGRSSDLGKYKLFAEWAMDELGVKVDPKQAQFTVLNYKNFQASDLNKEYNEERAAERAEAAEERAAKAAEREQAREAKAGTATKKAPAKKAAAKKTAAADSAPRTAKRTTKSTAKKATAKRGATATEEF
jgi:hypothetical protein